MRARASRSRSRRRPHSVRRWSTSRASSTARSGTSRICDGPPRSSRPRAISPPPTTCPWPPRTRSARRTTCDCSRLIDRPNARVLLDTQNPALWGHDVAAYVERLWPRLANQVHVKDGRDGRMGNAVLGDGEAGVRRRPSAALRAHGFDGILISENDYTGEHAGRRRTGPGRARQLVRERCDAPERSGSAMEPLRVGFIGAGSFSTWAIYPALHLAPIDLRAGVRPGRTRRAEDAARRFGAPRWYTGPPRDVRERGSRGRHPVDEAARAAGARARGARSRLPRAGPQAAGAEPRRLPGPRRGLRPGPASA